MPPSPIFSLIGHPSSAHPFWYFPRDRKSTSRTHPISSSPAQIPHASMPQTQFTTRPKRVTLRYSSRRCYSRNPLLAFAVLGEGGEGLNFNYPRSPPFPEEGIAEATEIQIIPCPSTLRTSTVLREPPLLLPPFLLSLARFGSTWGRWHFPEKVFFF